MAEDLLSELRLCKLKILNDFYAEDRQRQARLETELAKVDHDMALLANASLSLPCLVRKTPGPEQTIYHSADAPCGRVRDRRNFIECTEHDALEEVGDWDYYLRRCTACNWERAADIHGRSVNL